MFSDKEIQKGLRIAVWEGIFATVHITLTTGAFLTGFALLLGANDFEIGLLTAIPLLTQILQVFSIHVVEHVGRRKWISGISSLLGRSLWAFLVLIPLLGGHWKQQAMAIFLGTFVLISVFLSFSGAPWLSWMADLVPAKIRGRYFGRRNMILGIVTMVTSILAGRVLDHFKSQQRLEIGFVSVELVAVLCAGIAFVFLTQQPEPPYRRMPGYHFWQYLQKPFRSTRFKKLLIFYLFFTFAVGVASSYFPVYLLKTLDWSFSTLALLAIGTAIMTLLTQPLWGRIIDRVGHKPVIKTAVIGVLPLPVIYFVATPQHSWPIWLDIVFTGIFWSSFNLAMFNMVFYSLPDKGQPMFLAVHSALTGMVNFAAMIIGGWIAQSLAPVRLVFLGKELINYHFLFGLTLALRLAAIPLLKKLEEPEAKSLGVMVRQIMLTLHRYVALGQAIFFLGNIQKQRRRSNARS